MTPLQAAILISEMIDGKAHAFGYGATVVTDELKITIERKDNDKERLCGDS